LNTGLILKNRCEIPPQSGGVFVGDLRFLNHFKKNLYLEYHYNQRRKAMKVIRQRLKPVSIVVAIFMLMISGPVQSAFAAMIATETVLESSRGQEARTQIKQLLVREDVRQALIKQGIDPLEAGARIDSLSDAEALAIADKLDQLPAGSGALEVLLIVGLIVFLTLLVTDIMGYTDIFPFVKK